MQAQLKVKQAKNKLRLHKVTSEASQSEGDDQSVCSNLSDVRTERTNTWVKQVQEVNDISNPMNQSPPDVTVVIDRNNNLLCNEPNTKTRRNTNTKKGGFDWISDLSDSSPDPSQSSVFGTICIDYSNMAIRKKFDGSPLH